MLSLVKCWEHLISPWIMSNILDFILPQIIQAVEDWDPLSDAIPIHSWVHPWIPTLGLYFILYSLFYKVFSI